MVIRKLDVNDIDTIEMIDAECFIRNAWRMTDSGMKLVEINWYDYELPNGIKWHKKRMRKTILEGGAAFGCFEKETLIGYACVNREIFIQKSKYVLLDQLFVSKEYRGKGIGKKLLALCAAEARIYGADKLYICAGSSQDTIAFYFKCGCVLAEEINEELYEEDPNDIQLELDIIGIYGLQSGGETI